MRSMRARRTLTALRDGAHDVPSQSATACDARPMTCKVAIIAALLIACGSSKDASPAPQPPPAPIARTIDAPPPVTPPPAGLAEAPITDAEFDALMAQAVAMFQAMGRAVDDDDDYCGRVADRLSKVFDDHREFIEGARKWKDSAYVDQRAEAWVKTHMDDIMPSMTKVGAVSTKCASNAKFVAVLKRIDDLK